MTRFWVHSTLRIAQGSRVRCRQRWRVAVSVSWPVLGLWSSRVLGVGVIIAKNPNSAYDTRTLVGSSYLAA